VSFDGHLVSALSVGTFRHYRDRPEPLVERVRLIAQIIGAALQRYDWPGNLRELQNLVRGVFTTPKSHQQRRVDMSNQLRDALVTWRRHERKRWLKKGKPMPATVFTARGDGANLDDANVRHVLTRILEKAELRHIRIHDLRTPSRRS
jgi:transcriptional regulator with AAA-type ATPase domain